MKTLNLFLLFIFISNFSFSKDKVIMQLNIYGGGNKKNYDSITPYKTIKVTKSGLVITEWKEWNLKHVDTSYTKNNEFVSKTYVLIAYDKGKPIYTRYDFRNYTKDGKTIYYEFDSIYYPDDKDKLDFISKTTCSLNKEDNSETCSTQFHPKYHCSSESSYFYQGIDSSYYKNLQECSGNSNSYHSITYKDSTKLQSKINWLKNLPKDSDYPYWEIRYEQYTDSSELVHKVTNYFFQDDNFEIEKQKKIFHFDENGVISEITRISYKNEFREYREERYGFNKSKLIKCQMKYLSPDLIYLISLQANLQSNEKNFLVKLKEK